MLQVLLTVTNHICLEDLLNYDFSLCCLKQVWSELYKINFNVKYLLWNGKTSKKVKKSAHSQIGFFELLMLNSKKLLSSLEMDVLILWRCPKVRESINLVLHLLLNNGDTFGERCNSLLHGDTLILVIHLNKTHCAQRHVLLHADKVNRRVMQLTLRVFNELLTECWGN